MAIFSESFINEYYHGHNKYHSSHYNSSSKEDNSKFREDEFLKVVSIVREAVNEAKSKLGSFSVLIMDKSFYSNDAMAGDYEDFIDGSYPEINVANLLDVKQNIVDFVLKSAREKVKAYSSISGSIEYDGCQEDNYIIYKTKLK